MTNALELLDAHDPRVEQTWRSLESQTPPSYFLSWGWVENWLATLPNPPPLALVKDDQGVPIGACFLGKRNLRRHVVFPSKALFLNATGAPEHDEICIEHNGLLGGPSSLAKLLELLPGDWDELHLPAIDRTAFPDLETLPGYRVQIDKESAAPYVDLEAVRNAKDGYVSLLGKSTRTQLRRARRIVGDVEIEVASDYHSAMDIFGELLRLHARRWNAVGERGAFADPWFERFHRRLITVRLAHGEIQLARVRAGDETIGCLYNFVYGGRVLFYQSGLAHFEDQHVKPGFLAHAAAIEYNAKLGRSVYDLLGGDARYKHQLATAEARLAWVRIQRPLIRFSIEDRLRSFKRMLAAARPRLALRPA